jgi:biopolymer transport protein ExbD/biopolymer transport protein TolR
MGFSTGDKTERTLSEINVTPLVDVMLALLIIFMITAPMIQRGMDVAVPKAKSGNVIPEDRLIITITKDNKIYAEGKGGQVGIDELPEIIDRWFANKPVAADQRTIYLRGDNEMPYATLMAVIDEAKTAGVRNVGLVTDPKGADDEKEGRKAP